MAAARDAAPARSVGYAVAVLSTGAALAVRWLLDPVLGDNLPYSVFVVAVTVTAWFVGLLPAVLAAVSGLVAGWWFFVSPSSAVDASRPMQAAALVNYLALTSLVIAATEMIRRNQAALRVRAHVLENMSEGVCVVDEGWTIVYANPAEEALFGRGRGELIGQGLSERFGGLPDERERILAGIREQLSAHGVWTGEFTGRRADGGAFIADSHITRILIGGRPHWIIVQRDVTAAKEAAEAIRVLNHELDQRAGELQAIMDVLPVGVCVASDAACREVTCNPHFSRLLGLPRGGNPSLSRVDAEALPYRAFRNGEPVPPDELPMQVAAATGKVVRWFDCELRYPDRPAIHLRINAAPLFDDQGNVRGAVGAHMDITALKDYERRLTLFNESLERQVAARTEELERRAGQLRELTLELTRTEQRERKRLAAILHDHLQQLLAAAIMRLEILQSDPQAADAAESLREGISLLRQSYRSARDLTAELSPPALREGDFEEAVRWLADWVREKYGLPVTVEADGPVGRVPQDVGTLVFESVRELLFNTVKHAKAGAARVRLSLPGPDLLNVVVEDNGVGRDLTASRPAGRAGGFGLFSIRERLESLGGRVEFTSSPGRGFRADISVPMGGPGEESAEGTSGEPESAGDARVPEGTAEQTPRRLRLLVADDQEVVRRGLASLLSGQSDMEVVGEAADGGEAIRLARVLRPDLVVMDVHMPLIDGIEATRTIRQHVPETRVVGLTAEGDVGTARAMFEAGASVCLGKDSGAEELFRVVRECVPRTSRDR